MLKPLKSGEKSISETESFSNGGRKWSAWEGEIKVLAATAYSKHQPLDDLSGGYLLTTNLNIQFLVNTFYSFMDIS